MTKIQQAVEMAIAIADDDQHGYSQDHRYGPDFDCSSLIAHVLYEHGFKVSKYSYTGNLYSQLIDCGFFICKSPWSPGDIHLTPGRHVCMSINENEIVHARINELGKITGGQPGDQTGNEISIMPYYVPSYGWKYHLRAPAEIHANLSEEEDEKAWNVAFDCTRGKYGVYPFRKEQVEAIGYNYDDIQARVNAIVVARKVIKGNYGNGEERRRRLEESGFNYSYVQHAVNMILENTINE